MKDFTQTITICNSPTQKVKCGGASINSNRYYNKVEMDSLLENKLDVKDVPTKVSLLLNDAGYLTKHQDLSNYAKKSEIPTNVSAFTNDAQYVTNSQLEAKHYLTEHQSLRDYALKTDIPTKISNLMNDEEFITEDSLNNYTYNKSTIDQKISSIGTSSYDDTELKSLINQKADKTSIPTKTSQLQNDSGFLTQHQSLTEYAKKSEVPSLNGYATEEYVDNKLVDYVKVDEIPESSTPTHIIEISNNGDGEMFITDDEADSLRTFLAEHSVTESNIYFHFGEGSGYELVIDATVEDDFCAFSSKYTVLEIDSEGSYAYDYEPYVESIQPKFAGSLDEVEFDSLGAVVPIVVGDEYGLYQLVEGKVARFVTEDELNSQIGDIESILNTING